MHKRTDVDNNQYTSYLKIRSSFNKRRGFALIMLDITVLKTLQRKKNRYLKVKKSFKNKTKNVT